MDMIFKMNIRKRRSQRLSSLNSAAKKRRVETTPLGSFECIPPELHQMIFSYLDVIDLSKVALASKAMCDSVEEFRVSCKGRKKFLMDLDVHTMEKTGDWPADTIQGYYSLGVYMKRTSFLNSTQLRLKHVSEYLTEHLICKELCGDGRRCISFYCYGTFLHTMIAGWDDLECLRVMEFVHQNTPVSKHVNKILSSSPGTLPHLEVYVRCFYRRAFYDVLRKVEDKAYWLCCILKPYPIINQARLMLILFLPKTSLGVYFTGAVYESWPVSSLAELGKALFYLSEQFLWSDDNIISVIDEIIALPSAWNQQNVASLLLNCGEGITLRVLISKSINNRLTEIVCIAKHLLVVSVKATRSIEKASRCIWMLMRQLDIPKRVFVASELVKSFKESVVDMIDVGIAPIEDLEILLEAAGQFTQDILKLALEALNASKLPMIEEFTKVNEQINSSTEVRTSQIEE